MREVQILFKILSYWVRTSRQAPPSRTIPARSPALSGPKKYLKNLRSLSVVGCWAVLGPLGVVLALPGAFLGFLGTLCLLLCLFVFGWSLAFFALASGALLTSSVRALPRCPREKNCKQGNHEGFASKASPSRREGVCGASPKASSIRPPTDPRRRSKA